VAQAARGDDGNRRGFFPRRDGIRDGFADGERAARGRLIRQVAGVLEDRKDRGGLLSKRRFTMNENACGSPCSRGGVSRT